MYQRSVSVVLVLGSFHSQHFEALFSRSAHDLSLRARRTKENGIMLAFPQNRDWKSQSVPCSCCDQVYAYVHMTRSTQSKYNRMRMKWPLPHSQMNASYMEAMYYRCVKEQWHCRACGVERAKKVELKKLSCYPSLVEIARCLCTRIPHRMAT